MPRIIKPAPARRFLISVSLKNHQPSSTVNKTAVRLIASEYTAKISLNDSIWNICPRAVKLPINKIIGHWLKTCDRLLVKRLKIGSKRSVGPKN